MRNLAISFFLMLMITQIGTAQQWAEVKQDAYDNNILRVNSTFEQKGDTLYTISNGNLYYSSDFGASYDFYEEFLALRDVYVFGNKVYATTKRELYLFEDGLFTEVHKASSTIIGVEIYNDLLFIFTTDGVIAENASGEFNEVPELNGISVYSSGIVGNELYFHGFYSVNSRMYKTIDGTTFTEVTGYTQPSNYNRLAIFDNAIFITSSNGVEYSTDGINWTLLSTADLSKPDAYFQVVGDVLIYGHAKKTYSKFTDDYLFFNKGDSDFSEFTEDANLGSFGGFLYSKDNTIYLLNKQLQLVSYDIDNSEWKFIQSAPHYGEYFYVGDTMILSSGGGYNLFKKAATDEYWKETFKYVTTGRGYYIHGMIELPSGRLLTNVAPNAGLRYSDDKGETWHINENNEFTGFTRFIARNDSVFATSGNGIYLSTDNGDTWTEKIDRVNGFNMKFLGANSIFVDRQVFSLSDFSRITNIITNNGAVQDYDTLNGFQYKGTTLGLFQKEIDKDNWKRLIQGSVIGVVSHKNTLIALTAGGVLFTSDDGKTFLTAEGIGGVKSYFVKGDELYAFGYSTAASGYRLFKANMNEFKPLPVLKTGKEAIQQRVDTLINVTFNALIEPRNFEVEVYFEYGERVNGVTDLLHTSSTKIYPQQEEPFTAEIMVPNLEASTIYDYKAILVYNDSVKVEGEMEMIRMRNKKYWERLDPSTLGSNYRDVKITRRGSIIAWGASGTIRSIDNGETWNELTQGRGIYYMEQGGGDTLLAGTTSGKFLFSTNEGGKWTETLNEGLPGTFGGNKRIWDITYDPVNHIYYALIGEREKATNNAVYLIKSSNSGNNWTTLLTSIMPEGGVIQNVLADSSGTVWVSSDAPLKGNSLLSKSTDFGENWEAVITSTTNTTTHGEEIIELAKDTLLFNSGAGLYASFDGGTTFDVTTKLGNGEPKNLGFGKVFDYSKKFGLISVNNNNDLPQFETGIVGFGIQMPDSLAFVSYKDRSKFGDPDEIELTNGNQVVVRNTNVSVNDMVLVATKDGIWRYIPSSKELPKNPNPNDVVIVSNEDELANVQEFRLEQNYPNPFNPSTTINFSLPNASEVSLKVYNMLGQEVATLLQGRVNAGAQSIQFDASNLSSGMYIYTLKTEQFSKTRKMLLIK